MKFKSLLTFLTAIAASSLPIQAAVIFAFNAEDGSSANTTVTATLGSSFNVVSDVNALGGEYLTIVGNGGGTNPGSADRVATYTISFDTAGNYDLYVKNLSPNAQSDSLFLGDGFGIKTAATASDWEIANGITSATYTWKKFTGPSGHLGSGTTLIPIYNVAAADDLIFQIGGREDGTLIDAIAFVESGKVLGTDFTASQLDAAITTPIPEPSAALLGGLGLLVLLRRRRA